MPMPDVQEYTGDLEYAGGAVYLSLPGGPTVLLAMYHAPGIPQPQYVMEAVAYFQHYVGAGNGANVTLWGVRSALPSGAPVLLVMS